MLPTTPRKKACVSRSSSSSSLSSSSGSSSVSSICTCTSSCVCDHSSDSSEACHNDLTEGTTIAKSSTNPPNELLETPIDTKVLGELLVTERLEGSDISAKVKKCIIEALTYSATCFPVQDWKEMLFRDSDSKLQSRVIKLIKALITGEGLKSVAVRKDLDNSTLNSVKHKHEMKRVQDRIKVGKDDLTTSPDKFKNWLLKFLTKCFDIHHGFVAWIFYKFWELAVDVQNISFENAEDVLGRAIVQKAKETHQLSAYNKYCNRIHVELPLHDAIIDRILCTVTLTQPSAHETDRTSQSQLFQDLHLSEDSENDDNCTETQICDLKVVLPEIIGSNTVKTVLANDRFNDVKWEPNAPSKVMDKKLDELETYLRETDDLITVHCLEAKVLKEREEILKILKAKYEEAKIEAELRDDYMRQLNGCSQHPDEVLRRGYLIGLAMAHFEAGKTTARAVYQAVEEYFELFDNRVKELDGERARELLQNEFESELVNKLLEELDMENAAGSTESHSDIQPMDTDE